MKPVIIIPARLNSSRLPYKPLADIGGQPMIVRVWEKAIATGLDKVIVACDHEDTRAAVIAMGGEAILTEPNLPSGSDRIWQALQQIDSNHYFDTIINLQGDLPTLEPDLILKTLEPITSGFDISTLAAKIEDPDEINREHVVKIAMAGSDNDLVRKAFYFSRCRIPSGKGPYYHHIGIYGYKRDALQKFVTSQPSVLEKREKLEQLRALELGLTIGVRQVETVPLGVDTFEDLNRARMMFQESS